MSKEFLRARFEALLESFDRGDKEVVEDTQTVLRRDLKAFLEAGCNANDVIEMLSPDETWANYDLLVSHGANIDVTWLMYHLPVEQVKDEWDTLAKKGVPVKKLARRCYAGNIEGDRDIFYLLDVGVPVDYVLELAKDYFETLEERPECWLEIVSELRRHGLSDADVNRLIQAHLSSELLNSIVNEDYDSWKQLGVELTNDMLDRWQREFGKYID